MGILWYCPKFLDIFIAQIDASAVTPTVAQSPDHAIVLASSRSCTAVLSQPQNWRLPGSSDQRHM